MKTFPLRPSRSDIGPKWKNRRVVRNAEYEFAAEQLNGFAFQIAGIGLTSPRARLLIDMSSSTIHRRIEAWNPDGETAGAYAPPELTLDNTPSANESLKIEYPALVPDADGNQQELLFEGGIARPMLSLASTDLITVADVRLDSPLVPSSIVHVLFRTSAGANIAPLFWLYLW